MANETLGGFQRLFRSPGRSGTFTLNGATPVVVTNRFITPDSVIGNTLKTVGGTPGPRTITSVTPGTGFTIVGTAGDTSVYNYKILG